MNPLIVVGISGAVAGTLDILSALSLARMRGMRPTALLQFVASGALGEQSFQGGQATALAGLFFHYLIALLWAALYFLASSKLLVASPNAIASGVLCGLAVHLVMSLVVVPLSRARKRPWAWQPWLIQLAIHIVCVGLPIVLFQKILKGK